MHTAGGRIDVTEADIEFDRSGDPKTGVRSVPIPPVLVEVLVSWTTANAIADDELLFGTKNDRRPAASNWSRALDRACRSARWPSMAHRVETLVAKYIGALEGEESLGNRRIERVLEA